MRNFIFGGIKMTDSKAPTLTAQPRMTTKKIATLAVLAAIAYVVMLIGRIPVVLFLKYDPKDVIIALAGFIYGPLSAVAVSVVVSFIEMLTVSTTGPIGLIMNVVSTCSFVCIASLIYKKRRSMSGAIIGLVIGAIAMTVIMMLWNYLITPIHMGYPRGQVAAMLVPTFLPFNLLKSGLNAALTILIYKPVVGGLRKARLLPEKESAESAARGRKFGALVFGVFLLAACVLLLLVFKGII